MNWPLSRLFWARLSLVSVAGVAIAGCKKPPAPPAPPPAAVTVSYPVRREIIEFDEYTGRLAPVDEVEVRARVSGFLESDNFHEGTMVKKGDLLFAIDPAPFQATYDQVVAEQSRQQAQYENDSSEFKRLTGLRADSSVSTKEFEDARFAQLRSAAAVESAKANVQAAKLNLDYTRVVAPISGRIGRKLVTAGNLIAGGAMGQSTLLTTIVSLDPIYCYIDADERSVLKYQRLAREQKRVSARDAQIPCWIALSDEKGFPHEGVVDFVNNQLDSNTGSLQARGVFANPGNILTPGLFAKMRIPGSGRYTAQLIPDAAIQSDQDQKFVFVVDDNNTVVYKPVKLGPLQERLRVIESGLADTDRVIVVGGMRVRTGAKVDPKFQQVPSSQPGETGAGSPATQILPATRKLEPESAPPTKAPDFPKFTPSTQPTTQPSASVTTDKAVNL